MSIRLRTVAAATAIAVAPAASFASTIFADTVIEYYDSGAGPLAGPYGGPPQQSPVSLGNATDGNANTYVSLPTGSFLTLGFSGGFVFDAPDQNDLFIGETGAVSELADVFVSSDSGATFTFLGTADGGTVTELDLASIDFTGNVNAVKVVGLDNRGGSAGFDLTFVQGLEGSVVVEPEVIPLPGGVLLLPAALGLLAFGRRRSA